MDPFYDPNKSSSASLIKKDIRLTIPPADFAIPDSSDYTGLIMKDWVCTTAVTNADWLCAKDFEFFASN